jgi:biopolymer transport protein ExbD/biopolymer transport protein TolR
MPLKGKSPPEVSTINVTPLCDVMLVLLIIFMVITPLLQNNVSVDMVQSRNAVDMDAANKSDAAVISITRDGKVYLGSKEIPADSVTKDVENKLQHNLDKTVYMKADARAKYGDVLTVVNAVRDADIQNLAMLTQQIQRRPGVPPTAATVAP